MKNKKNYKRAMKMLGTTNIFKTFLLYVKWILKPSLVVKLANKIYADIDKSKNNKSNIIAIGYLNEFFSKYLEFGKSKKDIITINSLVDRNVKTKNKIANTLIDLRSIRQKIKTLDKTKNDQLIPTKTGFGVSQGIVIGTAINFQNPKQKVPNNCIGIFPTSGIKYTTQFLKCVGIIFMNGSVTSHGAILAREFSIPAVVSPSIKINDNEKIEINGITGSVRRVVDRDN